MHLLSKDWLNARSNPEITFEIEEVSRIRKKDENTSRAAVTGAFVLNGTTKRMSVEAEIIYKPGKLKEATAGALQGDLLVVRSNFTIERSDFRIRPGEFLDKVANEINLSVNVIGAAPSGN